MVIISSMHAVMKQHFQLLFLSNFLKLTIYSLLQIIVMVCLYLGPLACGYSSSLISLKQRNYRDPDGAPDWTDHSLLLGGLVASVLPLPLSLRAFGRIKTAAMVSMILFFATVMMMVSDSSGSTFWMSRLSEFSVGLALGIHIPTQQLIIAETARPHQR